MEEVAAKIAEQMNWFVVVYQFILKKRGLYRLNFNIFLRQAIPIGECSSFQEQMKGDGNHKQKENDGDDKDINGM